MSHMDSHEFIAGIGTATKCDAAKSHYPRPLRFVWHHILPQACGGQSVAANLAELCDSCHYTVHILLYSMAHGAVIKVGTAAQRALAVLGYDAAVAAGTVALIPKESNVVIS